MKLNFSTSLVPILLGLGQILSKDIEIGKFKNLNLARTVDLSDPTQVKDLTSVVLQNLGAKDASKYFFAYDLGKNSSLASLAVQTKTEKIKLKVNLEKVDAKKNLQYYSVNLNPILRPDAKVVLNFISTHLLSVKPYPLESTQRKPQLLKFTDNVYFTSPYPSDTQKTIIKLTKSKLLEHTPSPSPVKVSDKAITYGPYDNVPAFANSSIFVHFDHKTPVIYVQKVFRDVEVSHWGSNLAIEEHYEVGNFGPSIKGEQSNLAHRELVRTRSTSRFVEEFELNVPKHASDAYYRDEIGNVSTSNFRSGPVSSYFRFEPRYPLYGGWNYTWYHGYNLPLSDSLSYKANNPTRFTLKIPFVRTVGDLAALDVTLRVVLPEGARDINLKKVSIDGVDIEEGRHFTYLDTVGRPTVTIKRKNVVYQHHKEIEIEYTLESINLLRKPAAVFVALFGFFLSISLIGRLNFNLVSSKSKKQK